MNTHVETDKDN